jgi:hypothetical protein
MSFGADLFLDSRHADSVPGNGHVDAGRGVCHVVSAFATGRLVVTRSISHSLINHVPSHSAAIRLLWHG